MVSATDVITYIGVPLAVLGVTPIFYTFAVALYTRLKIQRLLTKNGIDPRIRARLMTGVVEVDLPVFQLYTYHREELRYWLPSASPKTLGGASWSAYNFAIREIDVVTSRFQRSDKIILPEAKIGFEHLLYFLPDLGHYPDLDGFRTLRNRGQNTAGTSLIHGRDSQQRSHCTILEVAKPGDRHGLISLRFASTANILGGRSSGNIPNSNERLPPFCMTGLLLEPQNDDASLETDNRTVPTAETADDRIDPRDATDLNVNRRHFVIRQREDMRMDVSVHEMPAPSIGIGLPSNHSRLLNSDTSPEVESMQGEFWKRWFPCAAIAVYGFPNQQSFYKFLPNQTFLRYSQLFDIKVDSAFYYGLADGWETAREERLIYINHIDLEAPLPIQPTDGRHKIWLTKEDLETLVKEKEILLRPYVRFSARERFMFRKPQLDHLRSASVKYIAMPNLLRLCLHRLVSNPIQSKSLSIGSLPKEPWDINKLAQHTSDLILRMVILDINFAETIGSEIGRLMSAQVNPLDATISEHRVVTGKKRQHDHDLPWWLTERSSPVESGHFCCTIVLLAIIGQRASYLLSSQDVKHCVNEWPNVYLS
ncbi:hypothetical protein IMSHALPRED_005843 [Imshaugia aleurites]|uniref:Uncharacterized protein n=1 Tax=Imshaugia aleurites TaxID=172621 RepID=A0A8H3FD37_9LECA|nr:hypothetical protein IMSHALPRED_005843 [Imshaugia aleurites]